jgi:hypothetical protein
MIIRLIRAHKRIKLPTRAFLPKFRSFFIILNYLHQSPTFCYCSRHHITHHISTLPQLCALLFYLEFSLFHAAANACVHFF